MELAEKWAKENNIPFPPINAEETFKKEGMKEFYVFKHPTDPTCPIVIHIVLVNDKFRFYKKPGKWEKMKNSAHNQSECMFAVCVHQRAPVHIL